MTKVKTDIHAQQIAKEENTFYGFSIFDGWYYTGTQEELYAVGVVSPKQGRERCATLKQAS